MDKQYILTSKIGATISDCGKYRFKLWRVWDDTKPLILWVMLNPSKADAVQSDNTIDKITRFSKSWGYGGLMVGNLFPYRSKDPTDLKKNPIPEDIKLQNISHIIEMTEMCNMKILAHGNPPIAPPRIKDRFNDWHALKLTNSGHPYHPLYLKETLIPFKL